MEKSKEIYDGVCVLGFIFFMVTTFLCMYFSGVSVEDWLIQNVIIFAVIELAIFGWTIMYIYRGRSKILAETGDLNALKYLYEMILILSGIGVLLACMWFAIDAILFRFMENFGPLMIYAFSILIYSSFFFIWMIIGIYRINRKLKTLRKGKAIKKGYWNRNNLFLKIRF